MKPRLGVLVGLLALVLAPATSPEALPHEASAQGAKTERQDFLERFARAYFPGRNGQIVVVPKQGHILTKRGPAQRYMHGSPWPYDSAVPFWFYGPRFVKQGTFSDPVMLQDMAPTLAELLGVPMPATCVGRSQSTILKARTEPPRVIVLAVLDGMRPDYFDRHAAALPTLDRLRRQGAWFSNARVNYLPTITSMGHTTVATGADPRVHGIVANASFDWVAARPADAYPSLSPRQLMALSLADVWNIRTNGRAVIIGQGSVSRAAIPLAGHGGCVLNGRPVRAASYSTAGDGTWETNPKCYTMPDALKPFTARRYWTEAGGTWMGHDVASPVKFRHSGLFERFEGDALAAVLEAEPLGADDIPDLVLVNLKGPDYVGHAYGPASPEMREEMTELDRQLARALQILERKAGAGGLVVAIAADHGMPGEPHPGGRHYMDDIGKRIDARFSPGGGTVVQYFNDAANNEIHLDTAKLRSLKVSLRDVAAFLEAEVPFAAVYTEDEVRAAQRRDH